MIDRHDRAGAAVTSAAAFFGAREMQLFPQHAQQTALWIDRLQIACGGVDP